MHYLSTGQAAKMLLVTRDTVLKWIHQGKLPARKTAGGHYRIPAEEMQPFFGLTRPKTSEQSSSAEGIPLHCWEYFAAQGEIKSECHDCLVYKVKGTKCYEVAEFLRKFEHGATCCPTGCEECSFYKEHVLGSLKVVVLTEDDALRDRLAAEARHSSTHLKFARWEYECGMLAVSFRPDFMVVDCADDEKIEKSLRVYEHFRRDFRKQDIDVVLAVPGRIEPLNVFPREFLLIKRPSNLSELELQLKAPTSSQRPGSTAIDTNQRLNVRG